MREGAKEAFQEYQTCPQAEQVPSGNEPQGRMEEEVSDILNLLGAKYGDFQDSPTLLDEGRRIEEELQRLEGELKRRENLEGPFL